MLLKSKKFLRKTHFKKHSSSNIKVKEKTIVDVIICHIMM